MSISHLEYHFEHHIDIVLDMISETNLQVNLSLLFWQNIDLKIKEKIHYSITIIHG